MHPARRTARFAPWNHPGLLALYQAASSGGGASSSPSSRSSSSRSGHSSPMSARRSRVSNPLIATVVGPVEEREHPSFGADDQAGRRMSPRPRTDRALSGPLEPLFDAGAGHDVLAVTEPEDRLGVPLLVPEGLELLAQTLELGGDGRVMTLRKGVPQLGPPLARLLDCLMNVSQGHVRSNARLRVVIPSGRRRKRARSRSRRRPRRLRARSAKPRPSAVPELVQLLLVEAEIVGNLV